MGILDRIQATRSSLAPTPHAAPPLQPPAEAPGSPVAAPVPPEAPEPAQAPSANATPPPTPPNAEPAPHPLSDVNIRHELGMGPEPDPGPFVCCSLAAAHPDIAGIDAAIRTGGEDNSVRKLAERFHTNPSAIHRHKPHVFTPGYVSPRGAPLPSPSPTHAAANARAGLRGESPRSTPEADGDTLADGSKHGESAHQASVSKSRDRIQAAASPARKVFLDRVETVANIVALGEWRDRATVLGLSERWGIHQDEVCRIHRVAAARVRQARGTHTAQLETSVAVLKKIRDGELLNAKDYEERATKALDEKKYATAKTAKKLAQAARRGAMQAQRSIDAITVARPAAVLIQVGVQADPDFALAWRSVTRILDARFPGAATHVEEGLAVLEEGGEVAFERWLAASDTAIALEVDAGGAYALPEAPRHADVPDAELVDEAA